LIDLSKTHRHTTDKQENIMKKTVKKLSLNQETVRHLDDKELIEVQGGATLAACGSNATGPCSLCTKACSICCL
jgi:natural product precursor